MRVKISVVVSAYRLSEKEINRFLDWNEVVFRNNNINLSIVTDRDINLSYGQCLIYPKSQNHFSLPRVINYGIKRAEGIVIKTDLDIIFSNPVIQHISKVVRNSYAFIGICSNIDNLIEVQEESWESLPKRFWGWGACFAMTRDDWGEFRGYNEKIWGWGDDDIEIAQRVQSKSCLSICSYYPLFHMNHKSRKSTDSSSFYPIRKEENSQLISTEWNEQEWGEAKYD